VGGVEIGNRKSEIVNTPRLVLLGGVTLAVAAVFLSRFVLVELNVRRLGAPLVLALAEAVAILGVGRAALLLLGRLFPAAEASPRMRTDFVVGYPIFGTICFLVGWISTSTWVMTVVLVLGVAAGALAMRQYTRSDPRPMELSWRNGLALGLLALAAASGLASAQLPAVTLDEVAYHLAVPRIWVNEGRVVDLPLLSHSYFPFGIESADLPLLAILGTEGAQASHFLHLFAALAAALMIHAWLRKQAAPDLALVGTVAILTTPALLVTAGWSWIEWPLLGICLALLTELDAPQVNRPAVAALIAAGFLTKYSFPLFAAVLLFALFLARRDEARNLVKPVLIGIAAGSAFLLRNFLLAGNPLAPFIGPQAPEVGWYRTDLAGYIFDGALMDESLGIAVVSLALAAVFFPFANSFLRHAAVGLLVALVVVGTSRPSSRLLLPFLVPLAMLAIGGLESRVSTRLRAAFSWILLIAAALQLFVTLTYVARLDPFALLSGVKSDEQYAVEQRQPLASVLWIDRQLPAGSRTLVLGVNELFWFTKPVRGGGNFDSNRLSAYLRVSPDELRGRLHRDGITHVAVVGDGLRVGAAATSKRDQERLTTLDPQAAISLRELLQRHARELASTANTAIYQIR